MTGAIRRPEWAEPVATGQFLSYEGTRMALYRLDGLLWLRKEPVAELLEGMVPVSGRWYTRNMTPWCTRTVWLPRWSDGEPDSCRLLTLWGSQAMARASSSTRAPAFVAWVDALIAGPEALPGMRADEWVAEDVGDAP